MANYKNERINEDVKRELCAIIRTLKDPRISEFVSVVAVDVTRDLRYAKAYVSVLNGDRDDTLKGLNSSAGYVRKELGQRLNLRYTPQVIFEIDTSMEYGAHMNEIFNKINSTEDKENE